MLRHALAGDATFSDSQGSHRPADLWRPSLDSNLEILASRLDSSFLNRGRLGQPRP
jgi:hypothetical protein